MPSTIMWTATSGSRSIDPEAGSIAVIAWFGTVWFDFVKLSAEVFGGVDPLGNALTNPRFDALNPVRFSASALTPTWGTPPAPVTSSVNRRSAGSGLPPFRPIVESSRRVSRKRFGSIGTNRPSMESVPPSPVKYPVTSIVRSLPMSVNTSMRPSFTPDTTWLPAV